MSNPQKAIELRYQVSANSPDAPLLKYITAKETEFKKDQKILWALSGFWFPSACKWMGKHTDDQLKAIARNAIYELQKQISYLARTFGLEHELEMPPGINVVSSRLRQPLPAEATNGSNRESDVSTDLLEGLDRSDDDDLLDQMFN